MDWKEVFRPNKDKMGFFVILLCLVILIGFVLGYLRGMYTDVGCRSWSCYSIEYKIMTIATTVLSAVCMLPIFLFAALFPDMKINFFIWLLFAIVELAYLYSLTCFVKYLKKKDAAPT